MKLNYYHIDIPEVVTDEDIEKCRQADSIPDAMGNDEIELHCIIRLTDSSIMLKSIRMH
jgi:hypothetical protein